MSANVRKSHSISINPIMQNKYNIVVVPDIHHKHKRIQNLLDNIEYNKAIFIGDYYDDFHDSDLEAAETTKWLKRSLQNPRHIHLLGNHDLPYYTNGNGLFCSGYTPWKNQAINKIMTKEDWDKLKTFHLQTINNKKFLFTHAGLTNSLLKTDVENLRAFLNKADKRFRNNPLDGGNWMTYVGFAVGGDRPKGGIFWCRPREFSPTEGLCQIFGHTPTDDLEPLEIHLNNWAIDTHLNSVINITKKGEIKVINLLDFVPESF